MNRYKAYMERVTVSASEHDRLLAAMKEADEKLSAAASDHTKGEKLFRANRKLYRVLGPLAAVLVLLLMLPAFLPYLSAGFVHSSKESGSAMTVPVVTLEPVTPKTDAQMVEEQEIKVEENSAVAGTGVQSTAAAVIREQLMLTKKYAVPQAEAARIKELLADEALAWKQMTEPVSYGSEDISFRIEDRSYVFITAKQLLAEPDGKRIVEAPEALVQLLRDEQLIS